MQNVIIDQQHLVRLRDESELNRMVEAGELVPVALNGSRVAISPTLPNNRRYVLPRVDSFLMSLSNEFYAVFSVPLVIDSAVRPVTVQQRLRRVNRNAAPIHGEAASSHEAGCTIDIARHRLSRAQLHWLELRLAYYQFARQEILVEEERACFHVMVTDNGWNNSMGGATETDGTIDGK